MKARASVLIALASLLMTSCDAGSNSTRVNYWGGKPPDPNVHLSALPVSLDEPPGSPDQAATTLATKVLARDQDSLPALLRALTDGGYSVTDADGSMVLPASEDLGLNVQHWEVEQLSRPGSSQFYLSLAELASIMDIPMPQMHSNDLAAALLQDIRDGAQSDAPKLRFWSHFMLEMGRLGPFGGDLLTAASPAEVHLNQIQVLLLVHRLAAGLQVDADVAPQANKPPPLWAALWPPVTDAEAADWSACNPKTEEKPPSGRAADSAKEIGLSAAKKFIKDQVKKASGLVKTVSTITKYANQLLAWNELALTESALNIDIAMDDFSTAAHRPLLRTRSSSVDLESRQLLARVHMDTGDKQEINCLRDVLSKYGIDYKVPKDGLLRGVETNWELMEGGVSGAAGGSATLKRGFLIFDNQGGRFDQTRNKTNDKTGVATQGIRGKRQSTDIPSTAPPFRRQGTVLVGVRLKGGDIYEDLGSAAKNALSGPAALLGRFPVEMLYRTSFNGATEYSFPVIDYLDRLKVDGTYLADTVPGWHCTPCVSHVDMSYSGVMTFDTKNFKLSSS